MKVPAFEMPLEEIRASLEPLRRPLSIAVLRARNPFNVGAIIRVAHSFLVREIVLVGDEKYYERGAMGMDRYENIVCVPGEADLVARARGRGDKLIVFEKDAARVDLWHADLPAECTMVFGSERYYERGAMGMDRYENIVCVPDEAALVARVRAGGGKLVVFEKDAARVNLWHAELPAACTMVFGSEATGVPDEIVRAADMVVGIPMYGINHSFPVTVAAGIAMAEWTRRHYVNDPLSPR